MASQRRRLRRATMEAMHRSFRLGWLLVRTAKRYLSLIIWATALESSRTFARLAILFESIFAVRILLNLFFHTAWPFLPRRTDGAPPRYMFHAGMNQRLPLLIQTAEGSVASRSTAILLQRIGIQTGLGH